MLSEMFKDFRNVEMFDFMSDLSLHAIIVFVGFTFDAFYTGCLKKYSFFIQNQRE